MSDLISKSMLIEVLLESRREETDTVPKLIRLIESRPTIEPKTGRWKPWVVAGVVSYACGECGFPSDEKYNYCPNCGARMENKE